ncbi:hypothetical protein F4803DRAFT_530527 [Xylaria telfairii]|nr:hypothetical protein F4803DRAFT_530527 [Xylaria telfairii]
MLVFSALPPPESNVWYLAYGSNVYKEKFIHDRGIVPLSALTVTVPGWVLAMDSAGFPYSDPSFGSISPAGTTHEKAMQVVGTAYELTPDMYAKVLASEGGGIAYAEVEIRAEPLPPDGSTGAKDTGATIAMRTLVTVMKREARPSTRYMGLIRNGAREAHMPANYQQFLARLPVYHPPTTRWGILGAKLFQSFWNPVMSIMEKIAKPSGRGDERGNAPLWVIYTVRIAVFLMWFHHDYFHAPIWGRGDGMEK